ncbi:hypothetical protein [Phreatobacter cathodiphilus]|uniref:hypothetical protein n=1 Tax=Phreatobacter cathodiphilus TaxID=1868589 RepID=UPI0011B2652C|nr:hypothetical protein [Phreatobacter cathodiphilus]
MADEKNLNTSLILSSASGDTAELNSLPPSVMQAVYYHLTGRTQEIATPHSKRLIVDRDSIVGLFEIFDQILSQYNIKGRSDRIVITDEKGKIVDFANVNLFRMADLDVLAETSDVSIECGVLIQQPATGAFQEYKINVVAVSRPLTAADFDLGSKEKKRRVASLHVSIEYVDYLIARNLSTSVDHWVESLEELKPKDDKFAKAIVHTYSIIFYYLTFLFGAGVFTWLIIEKVWRPSLSVANIGIGSFIYIVIVIAVSIVWGVIGMMASDIFSERKGALLALNRRDERQLELERQRMDRRRFRALRFGFGCMLAIALNLAASFVFEWIK